MSSPARGRALLAGLAMAAAILSTPAAAQDSTGDGAVTARVRVGAASNPLRAELTLSRSQVKAGDRFRAHAVVHNDGSELLHDGQVTLHASEAHVHVGGVTTVEVGTIRPGKRSMASWQLCSTDPGTYLVQLSARARVGVVGLESFSQAVEVTVTSAPGRRPATCPG